MENASLSILNLLFKFLSAQYNFFKELFEAGTAAQ